MNENAKNPYRPATIEDARHLHESRARLWPQVWACIIVVVALICVCGMNLGWVPTAIVVLVLAVAGVVFLVAFGAAHASGAEEVKRFEDELPGHDILKKEDIRITGGQSYDFDCAPADIYPYFAQMNLTKAGFYSFQHLERFFGFHIRNDYTIRPEWQRLECGDWMYYHQNGAGTGVVDFREGEYILTYSDTRFKPTQELAIAWCPKWMDGFAWTWNFVFEPTNGGEGTHFMSYLQAWWPESTSKAKQLRLALQWGLPSNFMMHGMAAKIGKLAEADARARRQGKPRPGYNQVI